MTAQFDYYLLNYAEEGFKGGFKYKTVPHVTLKSIANNAEIDAIYEQMHPAIDKALDELNEVLATNKPSPKGEGWVRGNTNKEKDRSESPLSQPSPSREKELSTSELQEWQVPFELPVNWPEAVQKPFADFHKARQDMQQKIDASIAANADQEILYD